MSETGRWACVLCAALFSTVVSSDPLVVDASSRPAIAPAASATVALPSSAGFIASLGVVVEPKSAAGSTLPKVRVGKAAPARQIDSPASSVATPTPVRTGAAASIAKIRGRLASFVENKGQWDTRQVPASQRR